MIKTNTFSILAAMAIGAIFFFGCSEEDHPEAGNNELVGKWELIEILADPGDGSGTFRAIDFYKTLTFSGNGKLTVVNGRLCRIDITSDETVRDNYSVEENSIITDKCEKVSFEFEKGNLIIHQPCIEGCAEKYKRVE